MPLDPILHRGMAPVSFATALRNRIADREAKLAFPIVAPRKRAAFEAEIAQCRQLLADEEHRLRERAP